MEEFSSVTADRYPDVRSAAYSLKQAADDLEHAMQTDRRHSTLLKAWSDHLKNDLKSILLLAEVSE